MCYNTLEGGGVLKMDDYIALSDYICSFGECDECPLGKYYRCETDPSNKEVLDIARMLSKERQDSRVEEILSRYERATII